MNSRRYFQLSFLWPVVLPVLILALPGPFLPEWIAQLCRATLYARGIPYAAFAAAMLLWSLKKDATAIRRSTYLAPVLFLPVSFVRLALGMGLSAQSYRSNQAEMVAWLFIYGILAAIAVLTIGYAYVAFINLVFVILRSWGVFEEDAPRAAQVVQNWELPSSPEPVSVRPAPTHMATISETHGIPIPPRAGDPYGFVSWDHEKGKGSATAHPLVSHEMWQTSSAGPVTASPQPAPSPGPIPGVPRPACSLGANWLEADSGQTGARGVAVRPRTDRLLARSKVVPATKPARKPKSFKPATWRDPLLTASLALLAPLILLSAFALCRHYGVLRAHSGANYPAASAGRKTAVPAGRLEHR